MELNLDTLEVLPFSHTSTHAYTHGVENNDSDKISRMVKGTKLRILK